MGQEVDKKFEKRRKSSGHRERQVVAINLVEALNRVINARSRGGRLSAKIDKALEAFTRLEEERWARLSPTARRIRIEVEKLEEKIFVIRSEAASRLNRLVNPLGAKLKRLRRECPHENTDTTCDADGCCPTTQCLDCGSYVDEDDLNRNVRKRGG